jgi:hypothetical protein
LDGDSAIGLVGDGYSSHHYNYTHRGIISDQFKQGSANSSNKPSIVDRYGYENTVSLQPYNVCYSSKSANFKVQNQKKSH